MANITRAGLSKGGTIDGNLTLSGTIITTPDSYTKLLIHSDTTDGSTTFVDSSPSGHTITAAGNLRHETDYSKFGATSIFIPDAQTDTAEIPLHSDFEFTGDFTIDMWVNVSSGGDRSLYVQHDGSTYFALNYSKSATQFNLYTNSGGASPTPAYDLVGWNHVAWIRSGDQLVLYVNGTAINTVTNGSTLGYAAGNQTLNRLGGGVATTPYYCDEFRVSKGIARWSSNFTPPNKPYDIINTETQTVDAKEDSVFEADGGGNAQFGSNIITRSDPSEASTDSVFSASAKDGTVLLDVLANGNATFAGDASFTNDVEVSGKFEVGEDVLNSTPAYTKLAVFGGFYCDTQGYPFVVHDLSMGDNLLEIDGNEGWIKIDPEGQLGATEFGSGIDVNGDVLPRSDNTKDLGDASYRWANLYVADMQMNNEGTGGNDVDGTEGSWTIQEGEDDLFVINRKTGKKFKIKLEAM